MLLQVVNQIVAPHFSERAQGLVSKPADVATPAGVVAASDLRGRQGGGTLGPMLFMTSLPQQRICGTDLRSDRRTIPALLHGTASRISAHVSCRACGVARACFCRNPTRVDTLHAERVGSGEN